LAEGVTSLSCFTLFFVCSVLYFFWVVMIDEVGAKLKMPPDCCFMFAFNCSIGGDCSRELLDFDLVGVFIGVFY